MMSLQELPTRSNSSSLRGILVSFLLITATTQILSSMRTFPMPIQITHNTKIHPTTLPFTNIRPLTSVNSHMHRITRRPIETSATKLADQILWRRASTVRLASTSIRRGRGPRRKSSAKIQSLIFRALLVRRHAMSGESNSRMSVGLYRLRLNRLRCPARCSRCYRARLRRKSVDWCLRLRRIADGSGSVGTRLRRRLSRQRNWKPSTTSRR